MTPKKQFSGTSKSRTFYDRKVLRHGAGAQLSLGRIIPKDWRYVRVTVLGKVENCIHLTISKLLGDEINATANMRTMQKGNKT